MCALKLQLMYQVGKVLDRGGASIDSLVGVACWTDDWIDDCKTNFDAPLKGVGRTCCTIGFDAVVDLVSLISCCCTICFEAPVDVVSGVSICPDRWEAWSNTSFKALVDAAGGPRAYMGGLGASLEAGHRTFGCSIVSTNAAVDFAFLRGGQLDGCS